jgi:hypothetical protein
MAICRPKAIDDAPPSGRSAAEDGGGETFLGSRGMGEAQGKKVSPPPLRPRRSRRSRPLARSSHQRPRGLRRSDSTEEKTWRKSSDPHKRPPASGEGKETLACRWASLHVPTPGRAGPMANRVAPDGDDASIRSKHRDEPRYGSRAGDPKRLQPPLKSQTAEARPAWAATSADKAISRRRQCLVRRRARGSKRHTRPGRCRHDDCARNCYCLSPTFSGYTNVRESECGMISSDSSW